MNRIAIIGKGKVGTATAQALATTVDFHDPMKGYKIESFEQYDYVIVCVDTLQQGFDDHSHIDAVLSLLRLREYSGIVVIRSTLNPEWVNYLESIYQSLNIILFPEFMVQRGDKINDSPWQIVLGGSRVFTETFYKLLIELGYGTEKTPVTLTDNVTASMIKLSANSALAAKVTTFNAIYLSCKTLGVDYETVRNAITRDERIGSGHTTVPSPDDGRLGFGGHCLPKDIQAMADIDKTQHFEHIIEMNWRLGR